MTVLRAPHPRRPNSNNPHFRVLIAKGLTARPESLGSSTMTLYVRTTQELPDLYSFNRVILCSEILLGQKKKERKGGKGGWDREMVRALERCYSMR